MKKIVSLLLVLIQIVLLVSCSTQKPEKEQNPQGNTPITDNSQSGEDESTEEQLPHVCEFNVETVGPKTIKTRASCTKQAEYYYSCTCGKIGEESFLHGDLAGHDYYIKSAIEKYLVKEATVKTSAVYYKSCKCGAMGESMFEYGAPLQLNEEQKAHLPTSLTVTLYDTVGGVYGFTYNSFNMPIDPVIQIKQVGESEWSEYVPASCEATTVNANDVQIPYYISKAEIALAPDTEYVYRVCDKGVDVATPESTLKTKSSNTESFTFAHVSDSQAGPTEFGWVMKAVSDNVDFVVHTGDVVQYAHKEQEWTDMLDGNYEYVAGMPIMAITGNHETSYNNATYEIEKHFNNQMPEQSSTALGYYYSFVYGNVKFIMLNTNDLEGNKLKAEQYDWLIGELESNTCKWTIVAMHNPMYSVGKYGADETRNAIALALREQLGGVFAEYGVDLVLEAHDHAISRTFPIGGDGVASAEVTETIDGVEYIVDPDGVVYVMNGPAGTQQRAPVAVDESLYAYAEASKPASWAEITVDGDTLTVTVKWHTGTGERVYHTWGIKKS